MLPDTPFLATYDGSVGHDTISVPLLDRRTNGTHTTYEYTLMGYEGNDTLTASGGRGNWPYFNSDADPTQPLTVYNQLTDGEGDDWLYSSTGLIELTLDQAEL